MRGPEPEVEPRDYKTRRRYDIARQARALNFACFRNQPFLRSERACGWLCEAIAKAVSKHDLDVWAYCLMPSHVHLMVCPRGEAKVSALLAGVKLAVTKRAVRHVRQHAPAFLERMTDISGDGSVTHRFWQRGGGYDRNLWSANAIWKIIDYIHMNPVEDGLVTRPEDWVWSSAAWYRDKRPSPIPLNIDRVPMRRSR